MDIRIGISESARELDIEADDSATQEEVEKVISDAITSGELMVWFLDRKGKKIGVPTNKIAYVEIGPNKSERKVGFAIP